MNPPRKSRQQRGSEVARLGPKRERGRRTGNCICPDPAHKHKHKHKHKDPRLDNTCAIRPSLSSICSPGNLTMKSRRGAPFILQQTKGRTSGWLETCEKGRRAGQSMDIHLARRHQVLECIQNVGRVPAESRRQDLSLPALSPRSANLSHLRLP